MRIQIQSIDWKIWDMIEDGYTSPTIEVDSKKVPKLGPNGMRGISLLLI